MEIKPENLKAGDTFYMKYKSVVKKYRVNRIEHRGPYGLSFGGLIDVSCWNDDRKEYVHETKIKFFDDMFDNEKEALETKPELWGYMKEMVNQLCLNKITGGLK